MVTIATQKPTCCSFPLSLVDSLSQWRVLQLLSSACPLLSTVGVSKDPLLRTWKSPRVLNLWYLCQLWDLSLVSSLDKPRTCRPLNCTPTVSAEHLTGLLWWIICRHFWAHAHMPGTHEPLGHWNSNVNTQILEEFPAWGVPLEIGIGHRAQRRLCWPSSDKRRGEGGRDTVSPCGPSPPPLTLRSGKEGGTQGLQRHDQHTEHYTAHWGVTQGTEKLTWHSMLIAWRLSTIDISTVPKPK